MARNKLTGKPLKPKPMYGVDKVPHLEFSYTIKKMDEELNVVESYTVYKPPSASNKAETCDCFAGLMGKHCRHKLIVDIFIAAGAVGTTRLYCYDHKEWVE